MTRMQASSSSCSRSTTTPFKLYGRTFEHQLLLQAYQRSKAGERRQRYDGKAALPHELVLIQGPPGIGKTSLAQSIQEQVVDRDGGLFLTGTFDGSHPYQAFSSAFCAVSDLMQRECHHDAARRDKMRKAIREAIGSQGKILLELIPALQDFVDHAKDEPNTVDKTNNSCDDYSQLSGMEQLHRFQFIFSRFVLAISSVVPLVLFLDDLQWIDPASLSLLQFLLKSPPPNPHQPPFLLVICTFQEETSLPPLQTSSSSSPCGAETANSIHDFWQHVSSFVNLTTITLDRLEECETFQLVQEYLEQTPHQSCSNMNTALAPLVVYDKSKGNPFYAMQLLQCLIVDSKPKTSETWSTQHDIYDISGSNTPAGGGSGNKVEDFLRHKLSLLPPMTQIVLQTAACIGNIMDHTALRIALDKSVSGVDLCLQILRNEGVLELYHYQQQQGQYRFAHNLFRQAALSMIDNRNATCYRIGHQLWTKSTPAFLTKNLLVIANLVNHGHHYMTDPAERYKAAALNLEAGIKAMSLAAFPDASRFLHAGIEFLKGGDYWKDQYQLSLRLFQAAAQADVCHVNVTRVPELIAEIVQHAQSPKDKLRAHMTQMELLGRHRGNPNDAIRVGVVHVLKELGEPIPIKVTSLAVIAKIFMTKFALMGHSNYALLSLPPMKNDTKIACMVAMTEILKYAECHGSSHHCPVIGARLVQLYLQHGKHKLGAIGFCVFGCTMAAFDRKEGYRLGTVALELLDKYRAQDMLPRVYKGFYGLLHHWRRPLRESLQPLEKAYKVGMEVGDVVNGMTAAVFRLSHALFGGRPLVQVEAVVKESIQQMRLFRQDTVLEMAETFHQFVHNLTGRAPHAKLLTGDVVPQFDAATTRTVDSPLIPFYHYYLGAELAYMFGDLDLAATMIEKFKSLRFQPTGFYCFAVMRFKEALISVARARTVLSTKKKNTKTCKKVLKQLWSWAEDCPENFRHKQLLVQAELKSLSLTPQSSVKKTRKVFRLYDQAIQKAMLEGFVHEAALANELAGEFSDRLDNSNAAGKYLDEAHGLYVAWGATEKAKHLSTSWADYFRVGI